MEFIGSYVQNRKNNSKIQKKRIAVLRYQLYYFIGLFEKE